MRRNMCLGDEVVERQLVVDFDCDTMASHHEPLLPHQKCARKCSVVFRAITFSFEAPED
jgi:hypothetical protein